MEEARRLAERNLESWLWMIDHYEESMREARSNWSMPLLQLVRQLAASERVFLFRAGPSLGNLVISTKADYGLSFDDPRIVVMLTRDHQFEVTYSRGDDDTPETHLCTESNVLSTLAPLLDRLWNETSDRGTS